MHRSIILFTIAVLATSVLAVEPSCEGLVVDAQAYYNVSSLTHGVYRQPLLNVGEEIVYDFCALPDISTCLTLNIDGLILHGPFAKPFPVEYNNSAAIINVGGVCKTLTKSMNPSIVAKSNNNPEDGLVLNYKSAENNSFTIELTCNKSENYTNPTYKEDNGAYTIYAESKRGCPEWGYYQIQQFVQRYRFIFVAIGVVTGIFICFLGLKLFAPSLFIVTFLGVFLVFFFILFQFALESTSSNGARWGCVAAAAVLAIIAGVLMVKLQKLGVFVLGAWLGVISLNLGYSLIVAHLGAGQWVYILLAIGAGLLGGAIAYFTYEHAIIVATAVGGAYISLKAISLLLPLKYQFPNEFNIAKSISNGETSAVPVAFYVYFAFVIVIGAAGIYVQYKYKKDKDAEKDDLGFDRLGYPTNPYGAMNNA